ncbi:hypothetical protein [Microbacterium halophytorum]|uniref:hypothetical protein n=1 Tax=Microbacterium halophytorum TaxID=2067568 RepID=UPI000CFCBA3F|nr:hypothetical protein [Microbacterium halophytorum]
MNEVLDTVIWLVNMPATHGYAFVFIAAFGSFGLLALTFKTSSGDTHSAALRRIRMERGLPVGDAPSGPGPLSIVRRWFFGLLSIVVLGGGIVGLASLIFGPVTGAYIYANGVEVEAESIDSDYVRFTAEDGQTYVLSYSFFTAQSYPEDEMLAFADRVVVRYLPGHPQAYVLDTRASTDTTGRPLGS